MLTFRKVLLRQPHPNASMCVLVRDRFTGSDRWLAVGCIMLVGLIALGHSAQMLQVMEVPLQTHTHTRAKYTPEHAAKCLVSHMHRVIQIHV